MRLASVSLALLLVLSACNGALGQGPPERRGPQPPPPPSDVFEDPGAPGSPGRHGGPGMRDNESRSHGWRNRQEPMTEEQAREALEVLRVIDPDKAQRIEQAIDENPEQIGRVLQENFPNIGRFMAWRRYDPEGFDLRIRDLALSRQTHACVQRMHEALDAGDDEMAALEQIQLSELVAEHFDVRQTIREYELAKLQRRIEELIAQLEERTDNRDELIDERIDELIGEGTEDRW
jgi:hypothetical protein